MSKNKKYSFTIRFQFLFVNTSVGLDLSLIWINYSPEFCLYKTFLKSSLPVIAGISISFSTVIKFYILCFKKSMLEINDKKVSIFSITSIIGFTVMMNAFKYKDEAKLFGRSRRDLK